MLRIRIIYNGQWLRKSIHHVGIQVINWWITNISRWVSLIICTTPIVSIIVEFNHFWIVIWSIAIILSDPFGIIHFNGWHPSRGFKINSKVSHLSSIHRNNKLIQSGINYAIESKNWHSPSISIHSKFYNKHI